MLFGFHSFELFWIVIGFCSIGHLLTDAVVCLVSRDTGFDVSWWLQEGGGACAHGFKIRRRLSPDVCSCCVSRNASVSVA